MAVGPDEGLVNINNSSPGSQIYVENRFLSRVKTQKLVVSLISFIMFYKLSEANLAPVKIPHRKI